MRTKHLRLLIIAAALLLALTGMLLLLTKPAGQPDVSGIEAPAAQPAAASEPAAQEAAGQIAAPAFTDPQAIADYIFANRRLPDHFITRREAEALGYDADRNFLSDVAPGLSLGGDRFGNYENLLPKASTRTWKECDANYISGPRGTERIIYSNDGLVYYTADHYETYTQMFPSP